MPYKKPPCGGFLLERIYTRFADFFAAFFATFFAFFFAAILFCATEKQCYTLLCMYANLFIYNNIRPTVMKIISFTIMFNYWIIVISFRVKFLSHTVQ